jgi:hypothetical protein
MFMPVSMDILQQTVFSTFDIMLHLGFCLPPQPLVHLLLTTWLEQGPFNVIGLPMAYYPRSVISHFTRHIFSGKMWEIAQHPQATFTIVFQQRHLIQYALPLLHTIFWLPTVTLPQVNKYILLPLWTAITKNFVFTSKGLRKTPLQSGIWITTVKFLSTMSLPSVAAWQSLFTIYKGYFPYNLQLWSPLLSRRLWLRQWAILAQERLNLIQEGFIWKNANKWQQNLMRTFSVLQLAPCKHVQFFIQNMQTTITQQTWLKPGTYVYVLLSPWKKHVYIGETGRKMPRQLICRYWEHLQQAGQVYKNQKYWTKGVYKDIALQGLEQYF